MKLLITSKETSSACTGYTACRISEFSVIMNALSSSSSYHSTAAVQRPEM